MLLPATPNSKLHPVSAHVVLNAAVVVLHKRLRCSLMILASNVLREKFRLLRVMCHSAFPNIFNNTQRCSVA